MAAPTTYITLVKQFTYRGDAGEEWSNSYALSGSTPADSAAWRALFDALVLEEKKLYGLTTFVVAGYGYDGIPEKGDHAIWALDLLQPPNTKIPGTLPDGGLPAISGDQAAWVRWGLDRFTEKGKRVYLRKYFHGGYMAGGQGGDTYSPTWRTALTAFGTKMWDGSFAGSRHIVDKDGNAPIGTGIAPFLTTRTLKRRGKRPPTSA